MKDPPGVQRIPDTVSRGSRDKQPRAFGGGKGVRVVGEDDVLITVCPPEAVERYLGAPNAEVKRRVEGSIKFIRLRSVGDDRRHIGENHGRSTVTTERIRNDWGKLVGSDLNLKHKQSCAVWKRSVRPESETA
jgi:hypothetical protein